MKGTTTVNKGSKSNYVSDQCCSKGFPTLSGTSDGTGSRHGPGCTLDGFRRKTQASGVQESKGTGHCGQGKCDNYRETPRRIGLLGKRSRRNQTED